MYTPLTEDEKQAVITAVRRLLEDRAEISFAYLHGSFMSEGGFRDIDVAVFVDEPPVSPLDYELLLETESMKSVRGLPMDVRVLNNAPLSFRYNVIKNGLLLFARDDDKRADFVEYALSAYFDFAPYRTLYLKETLGIGV